MYIKVGRASETAGKGATWLPGLVSIMLLFTAPAWAAGIFRVDASSSAVTPDGQSWGNAYKTLQAGVDAAYAAGGGEVWAKAGVYAAATNPVVTLKSGVSLYGGFAGSEAARTERSLSANATIIDGGNTSRCVNGADSATLDGFLITRGMSDGGAGMNNDHASPTVANCAFIRNSAVSFGGGIYNISSAPMVVNCTFVQNSAGYQGGGMNSGSSSPTVTNCTFAFNTATSQGGGLYNGDVSSVPKITNCILWGNTAPNGPQVFNSASVPVITYSCVQGGFAGTGNISDDPTLIDTNGGGSVQLWAGSPCVDAGILTGAPGTDLLGHPRPQGTKVDMGAYEGAADPANIITLMIQVAPYGAGHTSPAENAHLYVRGETAVVTAQALGMRWTGWSGDVTGSELWAHVVMDTDKTVTANFAPNTVYVNKSNSTGPWDGRSWGTAFRDIQSGVNTALADGGGEVWVKGGVYIAATDPVVTMKPSVSLYGGFAGTEFDRNARNAVANTTTIDGENARRCIIGANQATLDGFTVTRGLSTGDGAGMYNVSASPTVANCTFSVNKAITGGAGVCRGGGMYNFSSSPLVTGCSFTQNTASGGNGIGGGMFNAASSPVVTDCQFTNNTASSTGATPSSGGGMFNSASSSPMISNCNFIANSATAGGGMSNSASSPMMTNCSFSSNTANNGGGINNDASSPFLDRCSFSYNIVSSAIPGGTAYGGGMCSSTASAPTLINVLFTGNGAYCGGAMANLASSPVATNCTFTLNSAATGSAHYGGGLYNSGASASPKITNCILWGDTAPGGPVEIYDVSATPVVAHSCVQGGYAGTANVSGNPLFVSVPGDLRLQDGSPCIDTGTSSGAPGIDIRAVPRPQGAEVDMGIYEMVPVTSPPVLLVCPGNFYATPNGSCEVVVPDITGTMYALDDHDPALQVTQLPAAGTLASAGYTSVTLTATNDVGLFSTCYATLIALDTLPPVITRLGTTPVTVECHSAYTDAGATATDNCSGDLTASISVENPVNVNAPGSYTVRYRVSDAGGNSAAEVTRIVNVVDTTKPVITLTGSADLSMECGSAYVDSGATAADLCGGNLSSSIVLTNPVNANVLGVYTVRYNLSDASANSAVEVTRTVSVVDSTLPVITLLGTSAVTVECHGTYTDAGATALDACAGDLTASILVTSPVNVNAPGAYTLLYNVNDGNGNSALELTRTVNVVDTTLPVITLLGTSPVTVECHGLYADAGATALDSCAGDLTAGIVVTNPVNVNVPGAYTVLYNVSDGNGNSALEVTRVVNVVDGTAPVITLVGTTPATVECGSSYIDAGATATDVCAGTLSAGVAVTNPVNVHTPSAYTVRYNVNDGNGNSAAEVTRTVNVVDTAKPVITLLGPAQVTLDCGQSYTDAGATASDVCAGDLTGAVVTAGLPGSGPLGPGNWIVTYNVPDGNGNTADTVSRTVTVRDNCTLTVNAVGDTLINTAIGYHEDISVTATNGVGSLGYQWYKEAGSGKAFDALLGATEATLVFDPVDADSPGGYLCAVSDTVTTVNGPVFTLLLSITTPVTGLLGLATAAAAFGLGGAFTARRRKQ